MPTVDPPSYDIGELRLLDLAEPRSLSGQTLSKVSCEGKAYVAEVRGDGRRLEVGDITWENGERDVRVLDRFGSPREFDRLVHGFRFGVQEIPGGHRMRLRIPRLGNRDWPTAHQTSIEELEAETELDLRATLRDFGAKKLGTAGDVLKDRARSRNELIVTFDDRDGSSLLPLAAYTVTPILVMYRALQTT